MLLQLRFGIPIRFIEGFGGILEARETDRVDEAPQDATKATALPMVSSPSEITPLTGTSNCFSWHLTGVEQDRQITLLYCSARDVPVRSLRQRQSRTTQSTRVPHIWLQSIQGQDHVPLLL